MDDVAAQIEQTLKRRFAPLHFELRDDSAKHVGHPGATSGGGHYRVVIVSAEFEGRTRLEQHRMVNEALADFFGERIHALALKTIPPSEFQGQQPKLGQ